MENRKSYETRCYIERHRKYSTLFHEGCCKNYKQCLESDGDCKNRDGKPSSNRNQCRKYSSTDYGFRTLFIPIHCFKYIV